VKTWRLQLVLTALATVTHPLVAQGSADRAPEHHLFPPELIMQHQSAIHLQAEQRAEITQAIKDFQGRMVELQFKLQEETEKLDALLDPPAVDQAAALSQVDAVLALERDIKRAHLGLLIRIKNQLTPEQQEQLRTLHRHQTGDEDGLSQDLGHGPNAGDVMHGDRSGRRR